MKTERPTAHWNQLNESELTGGMLNKEFCIPLEELVDELAQPMSTADIAELTIQFQIGKVIKD